MRETKIYTKNLYKNVFSPASSNKIFDYKLRFNVILTQCFRIIILSSILCILGARIFKLYHLYSYLTNILYHNKYINTFVKPIYMHTGSS